MPYLQMTRGKLHVQETKCATSPAVDRLPCRDLLPRILSRPACPFAVAGRPISDALTSAIKLSKFEIGGRRH